jgi:hypothetical protein
MRILIVLLAASLAFAQDQPPDATPVPPVPSALREPQKEAEIIQVKTLTGDSFDRLVKLLSVFNNARLTSDSQMRTILVYAPKDVVAQIRHVVDQLDRPGSEAAIGKNIDLTLTLLRCSTKPAATPAPALPPDVEAVAKQLRAVTSACKEVSLLDMVPLRLQEGKVSSDSLHLPGPAPEHPITGDVRFQPQTVYRKDQGRFVRFETVRIDLRVPYVSGVFPDTRVAQYSSISEGLNTSGDFMEGQKTVLGKVSGGNDDEAIFAVIALKILD